MMCYVVRILNQECNDLVVIGGQLTPWSGRAMMANLTHKAAVGILILVLLIYVVYITTKHKFFYYICTKK